MKIKYKLFIAFITISIFSLLFILVNTWLFKKRDDISQQLNILEETQMLSLEEYKLQQEFFLHESNNLEFYKTGESLILNKHRKVAKKIIKNINNLMNSEETRLLFEPNFLSSLAIEQNNYCNIFEEVVKEIKLKGFKDFGIEGEMRNFAHALMEIKGLDQAKILMLRRHEKDFIIRKETSYIVQFNSVINNLKSEVENNSKLSTFQKIKLDSIINGYALAFIKLVNSNNNLIGSDNKPGLIFKLSNQHNVIIDSIAKNKFKAASQMNNIFKNLLFTAIFVILSIFTLAFIFSYRLASEVSKPIENLNSYINKFVESKFTIVTLIDEKKSNDEISILSNNFFKMSEEITNHIKYFEEKVKERTSEINKQNLEITNQKVKIHDQYKELFVKNLSLEKQQLLILEKNKDITDSILYAQRIQKAMMPSRAKLRNIVPNGFIFFQPRDIVSGDFYFTIEKDEKVFFGIADCTGHGVPGAFLSIIGNNALNKAINEFDLANPAEILNKVNDLVENSINNHDESVINDGMDIALCVLDKTRRILEYSGANIPLWIISEEEDVELELMDDNVSFATANKSQLLLKEFKPNKQPIGHYNYRQPFTNHIIHLKKNDKLYISSDGFADQFGGTKNKKFKNNQLRNLLLNVQFLNMDEQKQHIKEVIKNWKGANEQVDDITMLGIQV